MLFATRCPLCGKVGAAPCAACIASLDRTPALPPPPGVDAAHALLRYDGAGRELVARLKYRNARASIEWLARGMAELVEGSAVPFDVVTWIPTSAGRRRDRGFDQAALLARAVARHLGRPCADLLRRHGGGAQTGRSRAERLTGPALTFRRPLAAQTSVLVVDDVVTTGGTATAAARALRQAGAATITLLAAARTPAHRSRAAG